jgi:hypothetical protein
MARDPSPAYLRDSDRDVRSVPDRFEEVESREGDRFRNQPSGSQARGPERPARNPGTDIPFVAGRAVLYDRDRPYRLTISQAHTLRDLAKFRVIAAHDIAAFVYGARGESSRLELRDLVRQGLLRSGKFEGPEGTPRELLTLTSAGHRLVRENKLVPPEQSTYSGFVKPKEANHDADLYRMYQEEVAHIENEGGEPLRVVLDYELKKKINRDISRYGHSANNEIASRHGLSVVCGKIPLPDLQIEYQTREGDIARVSLELVTEHYRGRSVGEKVHAGFRLYTPHGEADRLRRLLDQHKFRADILSL